MSFYLLDQQKKEFYTLYLPLNKTCYLEIPQQRHSDFWSNTLSIRRDRKMHLEGYRHGFY